MKKNIYVLWVAILAASCSTMGKSEKSILEYMRNQTGSPKLKIEFADVRITKQTVGDSINILQEKYEQELKEKAEKITLGEKEAKRMEEALKTEKKGSMMSSFYSSQLENTLKFQKEWSEKVITNGKVRYDGRDNTQVIATIVSCQMTSLINPVLDAKQTKEGTFLLSADESICLKQLK